MSETEAKLAEVERMVDAQSSMDRAYGFKVRAEAAEAALQQTGEYLRTITQRAVAAEAERDKLRDALREIQYAVDEADYAAEGANEAHRIARAALAATEDTR